ncbi:UNKNOWN [Stylonychia lemnae]|uniref:Uncharacterized protein n=1 Tax=Stylonychia lemnae TaxID=5949 RepID=A0A078A5J0_STYLE|nr:UNKNOWN [Stylonychia lemnae]|eukprot:CDW77159.1 UNKNOWN [Stylonychia lemnae]
MPYPSTCPDVLKDWNDAMKQALESSYFPQHQPVKHFDSFIHIDYLKIVQTFILQLVLSQCFTKLKDLLSFKIHCGLKNRQLALLKVISDSGNYQKRQLTDKLIIRSELIQSKNLNETVTTKESINFNQAFRLIKSTIY